MTAPSPHSTRLSSRPERRNGRHRGVLVFLATFAVVGGIGIVALLFQGDNGADPAVVAPAIGSVDHIQTVSITVSGVSGHTGDDLAGVLYEGGELTDLEREVVGGFWSVVTSDTFTVTEVIRERGELGAGAFPFVTDAALEVEPGTYTLVVWVDTRLNPASRRVPVNTDGMGLYGCQMVFEVGNEAHTEVLVPVDLQPDGWYVDCTTGAAIPGTESIDPVAPLTPSEETWIEESRRAESGAAGEWSWSVIDEPWASSVVDVAPRPAGGFVVAATGEWGVLWSPDGVEWHDADPDHQVTVPPLTPGWFGTRPQVVTTIDDRVAVLDSALFGLWIGNPETQGWELIELDSSDLAGEIGQLAVASNETEVLVVSYEDDYGVAEPAPCGHAQPVQETRYSAWVVDVGSGDVMRRPLPVGGDQNVIGSDESGSFAGPHVCAESNSSATWFNGRWVVDVDGNWLVSADGATWTPVPTGSSPGPATLTAGPDTLLAEVWNSLWYSENGSDWTEVPAPEGMRGPSDATAYSDSFGYIATPWSDPGLFASVDGRNWEYVGFWPDMDALTASGERAFGIGEFHPAYLLVHGEPDDHSA